MRIIAGEFRSRKLFAPSGLTTRPMPDRVRESSFSMLGERIKNAAVVDMFAGTGSIGLEALSRGARSCIFFERDRVAVDALRRNITTLRVENRTEVVLGDALGMSAPARCPRPIDLVFLDPPFPLVREPVGWERVKAQASALAQFLAPDGFLVLRTPLPHFVEFPAEPAAPDGTAPGAEGSPDPASAARPSADPSRPAPAQVPARSPPLGRCPQRRELPGNAPRLLALLRSRARRTPPRQNARRRHRG